MSDKSFEDIAEAQGWNDATIANILIDFIDNHADKTKLIEYAQSRADEENRESAG